MASQIEKLKDYGDWQVYGTTCECMGHGMQITIQYDKFDGDLAREFELAFETRVGYWESWDFSFRKYWRRFTFACSILFLGRIEHSETFIFRNDEHVKELISTIINVRNDMVKDKNINKWYFGVIEKTDEKTLTYTNVLESTNTSENKWRQGDPATFWDNDHYPPDGDPNVEMEEHNVGRKISSLDAHEQYCLENGIDPYLQTR